MWRRHARYPSSFIRPERSKLKCERPFLERRVELTVVLKLAQHQLNLPHDKWQTYLSAHSITGSCNIEQLNGTADEHALERIEWI